MDATVPNDQHLRPNGRLGLDGALTLPSLEGALDRLFKEIELRQAHVWRTGRQFVLLVVALQVVPYANPDIMRRLGSAAVLFPAIAIFLDGVFTWLLYAEYLRLRQAMRKYRTLMGPYGPDVAEISSLWDRLKWAPIGPTVTWTFGLGILIISVVHIIIIQFCLV